MTETDNSIERLLDSIVVRCAWKTVGGNCRSKRCEEPAVWLTHFSCRCIFPSCHSHDVGARVVETGRCIDHDDRFVWVRSEPLL